MSIFEYDEEKEMRLYKEAVYQAGVDAGIEQGVAQGIQQKQTEMIVRMKESGLSEEEIAKISELTVEEVKFVLKDVLVVG